MKRISPSLLILCLLLACGVTYGQIAIPAGFPTAADTGLAGVGLTVGDLTATSGRTITVDGTVVDMEDISGTMNIQANNVTIKRCRITNYSWYAVRVFGGYSGTVIEDCLLPGSGGSVAITGGYTTTRRCDISGDHDGIKISSGVLIEDNYIHDQYKDAESHNDASQCSGGSNWTIRNNTLKGPYQQSTSAIIIKSDLGVISNGLVEGNFLSGGSYTAYHRSAAQGTPTNITFKNNVFEQGSALYGHLSVNGTPTYIGNVWHTGLPIPENPATGNQPPLANAGTNQTVTDTDDNGSQNVTLDGSSSSDSDGTITSYVWDENSSQIATGVSPTVSFSVGAHTVDLTVTDNDSATDSDTVVITVNAPTGNQAPTANAGSDQIVTDNDDNGSESVTLNGSGSSDSDGTITSYVWRENSSQIATGASPSVTLAVGSHTVELTVTDDDSATDTDNVAITVNAAPSGGQTYTINGNASDQVVRSDGTSKWVGQGDYRVGGGVSGADGAAILVFQLPTLGGGETIATATLDVGFSHISNVPSGNVDLYGLGYRAGSGVLLSDFYQGVYGGDSTDAWALQNDIATLSTSGGISTDATGDANLAGYLAAQYAAGAQGGDYVFLRLNPDIADVENYRYWVFYSANGSPVPVLTIDTSSAPTNNSPTADAGSDQTVTDSDDNGAENVTLDGSGSSDSDGTIASYAWEENSSQIATGVGPTVSFAVGGHTVVLTVTDDDSDTDSDSVSITVNAAPANQAPTADAGTDQTVTDSDDSGAENVSLDGSGSSDSDGSISSYVWDESSSQIATGVSPSVSFAIGTHTVDLTITDDDAATDSDSVVITVDEWSVTSSLTWQNFAIASQTGQFTFEFDAVPNSADMDGITGVSDGAAGTWSEVACIVRFAGTGVMDVRNGGGYAADTTLNYAAGTTYHVRVEISIAAHTYSVYVTPQGQSEVTLATGYAFRTEQASVTRLDNWVVNATYAGDSHTVSNVTVTEIVNIAPTADAGADQSATDNDDSGAENVTLDGSGSSDSDGTISSYVWDENSSQIATGVSPTVSLAVGAHTIDLTVTDDDSATDSDSMVATVNAYVNIAPTADAGSDQSVTDTDDSGAENVTLDGSGSSDSDGTISSYVWDENSSQIATGVSPAVSLAVGVHTIDLTVTDDDSATDSDSVAVTVNAAPSGGATYTIESDNADQEIRSNSTSPWSGQVDARIGGSTGGADGAFVMVFQLPTLATGETITSARLDFMLLRYSYWSPEGNADLYGLPYRTNSTVLIADFYQGAYGGDTGATALQDDIMVNTEPTGAIAADSTGEANLASYVAAQYAAGAQGGDYVFLRLNPDVANVTDYRYWSVGTANNGTAANRPVLTIVTGSGNAAPVADAGSDQTVTDSDGNGSATATLDGSGSSDSDGTISSYVWDEDASQIATGSGPSVTLDIGVHTIDLTVTDDDSATDSDSVIVTVVSRTLVSSTLSTVWPASDLPAQTGVFTVEYDAVPSSLGMDGVTGLSSGPGAWWDELACIIRFNTSSQIDARDGGSYTADTTMSYAAGTSYHFRLVVDVPNATYSVYVTPQGQSEVALATAFGFRTEQANITSIDNWTLNATSSVGTHTVSNLTITD